MYDDLLIQCSLFAELPLTIEYDVVADYYGHIRELFWQILSGGDDPDRYLVSWNEINIAAKADLLLLERLHLGAPLYEQTLQHMQSVVTSAMENLPWADE